MSEIDSAFSIVKKVHHEVIENGGSVADAIRMLTRLAEDGGYTLRMNGGKVLVRKPPKDAASIRLNRGSRSANRVQLEMVDAIMNEVEDKPYGSVWGSREVWDARRRSAYRVLCEKDAPADDEFVRISGKSGALKPLMKLYEIHSMRTRTDSKLVWFPGGEEISF
jgi:hypothetical protein